MIEDLEAEAVAQLTAHENAGSRLAVTRLHENSLIEIHARRRKDGAAVLRYSYDGVRLERATLLALICPQLMCDRSRSTKQLWTAKARSQTPLQRRSRTGLKSIDLSPTCLFREVPVDGANGVCVARPASFAIVAPCPMGSHPPALLRLFGWDVFKEGKYIDGGLIRQTEDGSPAPRFSTVAAVKKWWRT